MWKDYLANFIKYNRASSISIMIAALIASLFLSLLCSLFYNFWKYDIEQTIIEEGDWHGRITGAIDVGDISVIQAHANVRKATVNQELSRNQETAVDITLHNRRTVFHDIPQITQELGLEDNAITYHLVLLSSYFLHDPADSQPPLLLAFYVFVLIIVSFSVILIIKNSFAVSMNARVHQFGIFSSIGATPRQIRSCLMQEAAFLCFLPALLGYGLGVLLSVGIIRLTNVLAADVSGRHDAVWGYHPLILAVTVPACVFTILLSAWLPARKLSRITPLQAIRNHGGLELNKKKNSRLLALLFGAEGRLAGNALKAQKKALRSSALSLTLSFLGFTVMLCFFTLSEISTRHTYYEKYQDVWDIMVTLKDIKIEDFELTGQLSALDGVKDSTVYQKATATALIPESWQSEDLAALGGLGAVAGSSVTKAENTWLTEAPIVIMDDEAFKSYCRQIGIEAQLDGTVILNEIWDSLNSNFRYRRNIPYVQEHQETVILRNTQDDDLSAEVPVLAYTQEVPAIREAYDNYALVQFMPRSLWEKISAVIGGAETDSFIRILAGEGATLDDLNTLEKTVVQLIGQDYEAESENRIQDQVTNSNMINGFRLIIGAACILLAGIGAANIFANTLSFVRQRKRELAQYISVGMTPANIRKMFFIESLVIAGRPLLITLPLTIVFIIFAVTASYLDPMEFVSQAPILPVLLFALAIWGLVTLAYYLGGKKVLESSLSETLRDDSIS